MCVCCGDEAAKESNPEINVGNEEVKNLVENSDEVFGKIGVCCKKGWTFMGEDTPEEVPGVEELAVGDGGMIWLPKIDAVSVQIPQPHATV